MSWIVFALLAALIWAVANVADKIVISRLTREPVVPVVLMNGVGLFIAIGIFAFRGVPAVSAPLIVGALILGVFAMLPSYFYFSAAKEEEISRVVPLFQLANLFTPVIAFFTLGEVFTLQTYLSIILLVIGALLISSTRLFPIRLNRSFWCMIAAATTYAIYGIVLKYLLQFWNFWDLFSAMRIATFVLALPLVMIYRNALQTLLRTHGVSGVGIISFTEFVSMMGGFVHAVAASLGPITLVNAVVSVQPLLVLIFSAVVTIVTPQIFKEMIDQKTITRKAFATICIIVGALGIQ